ncbi:MAG TPA: hypothetical protein VN444_03650 [Verrucomicrobiae bacterium]|nr:hypothetical protein [Verrucomicrobiae bacterium]
MASTKRPAREGPASYEDHDGIRAYLEAVEESDRQAREVREREALYHLLLYIGLQWVTWDRLLGTYRPEGLKPTTPQPVTNKFAVGINALVASTSAFNPPLAFHPATEDADDIAAANVADHVLEVVKHEVKHRDLLQIEAKWLFLTGNVFRVTHYQPDLLGPMSFVQHERCQMCQQVSPPAVLLEQNNTCPHCGEQGPFVPAEDEVGQPIGDTVPRGVMTCEAHSVLTVRAASEADSLEESPYVVIDQQKTMEWVERTYGEEIAAKVDHETSESPSRWIMQAAIHSTGAGLMTGSGQQDQPSPQVRVRRLWMRPTPTFPGGLYAEVVGNQVVHSAEWPYHDREGRPILNITHTRCDVVPGRLWGKTRASDVAQKQVQRNKLEAVMTLFERRSSNDILMVPSGSGITKVTGQPGLMLQYNAMAGVPPPHREPGHPPPPYFIQRIQQIDEEIDALFGTYEILRGDAPKGVASYAGMQLLDERARSGQSAILTNWGLGLEHWARIVLNIWREYADDERTLATGEGAWAIQKFSKADLKGGVDVTVDLGMNRPYTQIGRRAVIDQGVRLGVISPYEPAERFRVLQLLGIPEIMEDYKRERMDASRENDLLMQGLPVRPPMPWENHPVHLETHKAILTGERFEAMPPEGQQAAEQHAQMHFMNMQQSQAPAGPGQIAPKPPGPNGGNGGTAKGDDGGEADMVHQDAQMASPDMMTGGMPPGGGMMA